MGCCIALEPLFIANVVVGHVAHGTSRLYHSVRSLHDLHSLGPDIEPLGALGLCLLAVEVAGLHNAPLH